MCRNPGVGYAEQVILNLPVIGAGILSNTGPGLLQGCGATAGNPAPVFPSLLIC